MGDFPSLFLVKEMERKYFFLIFVGFGGGERESPNFACFPCINISGLV